MANKDSIAFKKRRLNELVLEKKKLEDDINRYDEERGEHLIIDGKIELIPDLDKTRGGVDMKVIDGANLGAADCGRIARFLHLYAITHGAKGVV